MNTRRSSIYLLLALMLLASASLACGGSTPTDTPAAPAAEMATVAPQATQAPPSAVEPAVPTDTPLPTATPVPPATATPVPELYLGDAVSDHGYALTGVSVQDPATPGIFYTATSGKKLIAVEVVISNLSGETLSVNPLNATLVDTEGFTYQTELGGVDDQISTLEINPGERVRGLIAFEVPDNATAASIKYVVETFGSKLLQASLLPPPGDHAAIAEAPSTPASALPGLGNAVEDQGYSLSATAVEDPATPGILYQPREGYKLVAIEVVLGNVAGSEPLSVNPLYAYLVDDAGFVYAAELGGRDDQLATGELAVGEKVRGWVSFEVPDDATPASVKYSVGVFSGNYLQTGVTQ